jgi:hypothetical protein
MAPVPEGRLATVSARTGSLFPARSCRFGPRRTARDLLTGAMLSHPASTTFWMRSLACNSTTPIAAACAMQY